MRPTRSLNNPLKDVLMKVITKETEAALLSSDIIPKLATKSAQIQHRLLKGAQIAVDEVKSDVKKFVDKKDQRISHSQETLLSAFSRR